MPKETIPFLPGMPGITAREHPQIETIYGPLLHLLNDRTYSMLMTSALDPIHEDYNPTLQIPDYYGRVWISIHGEGMRYDAINNFCHRHSDKHIVILSDASMSDTNIWPSNVTYVQWITWGFMCDYAIKEHGINVESNTPTRKLSSLSWRKDFHKASVTAYLLNEWSHNDMMISWRNWSDRPCHWEQDDYYIDPIIKNYLQSKTFQDCGVISIDDFTQNKNSPIANCDWHHPAIQDCAINLTNESFYSMHHNQHVVPAPYFTDKTWKPLLGNQAWLPVGQAHTLQELGKLGMKFDYGDIDTSYDSILEDDDRMIALYVTLKKLKYMDIIDIMSATKDSVQHNTDLLASGDFAKNCQAHNEAQVSKIATA